MLFCSLGQGKGERGREMTLGRRVREVCEWEASRGGEERDGGPRFGTWAPDLTSRVLGAALPLAGFEAAMD